MHNTEESTTAPALGWFPAYYGNKFAPANRAGAKTITVPGHTVQGYEFPAYSFISEIDDDARFNTLTECSSECDRRNKVVKP